MRSIFVSAVLVVAGLHAQHATAETFDDKWSIIPKANAAPSTNVDEPDEPKPPEVSGEENKKFFGKASYYSYGPRKTASGTTFDRNALTAAHRSLPFGTKVRVTDIATGKSVVVVIEDRGPRLFGRILDLSLGAARALEITDRGVIEVSAEIL